MSKRPTPKGGLKTKSGPPRSSSGAKSSGKEPGPKPRASGPGKAQAAKLVKVVQQLEKKPVLYVLTSPAGGSAIDLHLGAKVPRRQPLELQGITAVQRHHEGELSVYVTCAWRLESRREVICGCWDDAGPEGQMRHGLSQIVGQTVRRAIAQPPAWDLTLELDGGHLLRIFCDQTNDDEGADNYAIFSRDEVFTVGTMSDLFIEPRGPDDD